MWPQWQTRLALHTGAAATPALTTLFDAASAQRGVQGAALLGDYYFSPAALGGFRASGGLMVGLQGGAPLLDGALAPRSNLGLGLNINSGSGLYANPAEASNTATYLGLGYTRLAWHSGLSLTADFGFAAERLVAAAGLGRALFGNQGSNGYESALREMRLSPVLQLGLRYTF